MKIDYAIADGSLVDRIYYGYDIGGLLNSGSYITTLFIILDSYILMYLVIFVLFLFIFIVFNSLQKKNELSFVFSPLVYVLCIKFINLPSSGGLHGIIQFSTRSFLETIFLNFLVISIYLM